MNASFKLRRYRYRRLLPDLALFIVCVTWLCATANGAPPLIRDFACFNTIFEIRCNPSEKIVFESGRFGRNDSEIANHCEVPYQRNCDIDVHVILNRACAGKSQCSMAVNTGMFIDPCGYDEFLRVTYRCAPASTVHQTCQAPGEPTLYDHGYIASPNYPGKYYMDARCTWTIAVQKRQTIKLTLLDFELVAKRGGQCHDRVHISTYDRVYFDDCGVLGKEVISINDHTATIVFETGLSSLTDRGFLLYFEAVGPGCPDLEDIVNGFIEYYIERDILYANATCNSGYYFVGTEQNEMQVRCLGSTWNAALPLCMAMPPLTSPRVIVMTTTPKPTGSAAVDHSFSLIGIALGVVSAILLISLLLVLAMYFHRRRRHRREKPDPWPQLVNNLQSDAANEDNLKLQDEMSLRSYTHVASKASPAHSNLHKTYMKKNKAMYEDEWQERKPLKNGFEEEDTGSEWIDSDYNTSVKYADGSMSPSQCPSCPSKGNVTHPIYVPYAVACSRDSAIESSVTYDQPPYPKPVSYTIGGKPVPPPRPPKRDLQHKRARSGQWEPQNKASTIYAQVTPRNGSEKERLSHSAPDLISMLPPLPPQDCCVHSGYPKESCCSQTPVRAPNVMRSSTLASVPANRVAKNCGRVAAKGKIRF